MIGSIAAVAAAAGAAAYVYKSRAAKSLPHGWEPGEGEELKEGSQAEDGGHEYKQESV